ncbi:spore coat protein U domain-containing protein [Yersinia ruckeri]|uniref:spore coat protein U domain-containing protein n=1 Tax=Yersinia ruckeri TaxID=29486 RepID=UPI0020BFB78D|nr:spore coat protein U domain-containing protein [Yersinia ruckeri]MCK8585186.1 spore coat U domain-containing protein [Yersinia ruckeri]MCW6623286.1 spore coat U domain-containing protein [Yersinia ruckeri]
MKKNHLLWSLGIPLLFLNSALAAGTTTGTIGATLTLTSACMVNGNPTDSSGLALGTLSFGAFPTTTFTSASATLSVTSGSNGSAISVLCSPGVTPVLTVISSNSLPVNGVVHGTAPSTPRYLTGASNPLQTIVYGLYTDSAYSTIVTNNTTVVATTTGDSTYGSLYTFFGNITGVSGPASLYPDSYSDTINVQITY